MWLSLNIISDLVDIKDISLEELTNRITMSTAEIEKIDYQNHFLKTIYTSKILDVKPHPNADRLTLVEVTTGSDNFKIVCGAKNHKKDDIVALAMIGTKFNEEFIIKKSKLRGETSEGMLCSEKELGLAEDSQGIMILPPKTPPGIPLSQIFPHRIDTRLEIDNKSITHRPDLWSHLGFAREIGAIFNRPLKKIVKTSLKLKISNPLDLKIKIKNPLLAPRYSALAFKNIKINESPEWLKAKITSIGMRPINNIVDITNYVMAELGQPLHAFDHKKLKTNEITIREAKKEENIKTLDEKEHSLEKEDIVIADQEKPIALAGVMGGANSEIDGKTTEIILESANFNPVNIRKTAQRLNARTDAAVRFEKSLAPQITVPALIRCYELIKEIIPQAETVSEIIDSYPTPQEPIIIEISPDFIRKKIGQEVSDKKIIEILTSLDFKIDRSEKNKTLKITVPFYRATKDINLPIDLVEEIGRIYGYDNIPPCPPLVPCSPPVKNEKRQLERKIKNILSRDHNLTEVSSYSFVNEDILNKLGINQEQELHLKNPLSQEQDRLRRNLIPNLIEKVKLNQKKYDEFAFFEIGRVYIKKDRSSPELSQEKDQITGIIFHKSPSTPLFYEAKYIVKNILERIAIKNYSLIPAKENLPPLAHPSRSMLLEVDSKQAGLITELHPKTKNIFEIDGSLALFDLNFDLLFKASKKEIKFTEISKFPEVLFEISIIMGRFEYTQKVCDLVKKSNPPYLKSVKVIAIYDQPPIPADKKSVSIQMIFAAPDRTLDSEEVEKIQNNIVSYLEKNNYPLR